MELAPQQRKSHHDTGQTRKNVRSCFFFFFFFFFFFSVERDPFFWMGTNPREPFDDALATGRLTSFLIHRRVLFFFFFFFTKKDKRKKQKKKPGGYFFFSVCWETRISSFMRQRLPLLPTFRRSRFSPTALLCRRAQNILFFEKSIAETLNNFSRYV